MAHQSYNLYHHWQNLWLVPKKQLSQKKALNNDLNLASLSLESHFLFSGNLRTFCASFLKERIASWVTFIFILAVVVCLVCFNQCFIQILHFIHVIITVRRFLWRTETRNKNNGIHDVINKLGGLNLMHRKKIRVAWYWNLRFFYRCISKYLQEHYTRCITRAALFLKNVPGTFFYATHQVKAIAIGIVQVVPQV